MRAQDIKINETYRLKDSPRYSYVKILKRCEPKTVRSDINKICFKCEHTIGRYDNFGFVRYFLAEDILKESDK